MKIRIKNIYLNLYNHQEEFKKLMLCNDKKLIHALFNFIDDPIFNYEDIIKGHKPIKKYLKGNTHYCEIYININDYGVMYIKILKLERRNKYLEAEKEINRQRFNLETMTVENERR